MSGGRWSLRDIYLYIVCLITLIMVIVGAAGTVRTVVEFLYPDPGIVFYPYKGESMTPEIGAAELDEQQALRRAQSTRQSALNLAGDLALVVIAGPLYAYHWRKIEGEL
ncbi:MAG: DUF5671 domain-containing protein, partial [Coriobacteriia bacterium]|nr:DUF5671 domain-containing protein [Coriobacteriia bacterium]